MMSNKIFKLNWILVALLTLLTTLGQSISYASTYVVEKFKLFSSPRDLNNFLDFVHEGAVIFIEIENVLTTPKSKIFASNSPYRHMIDDFLMSKSSGADYSKNVQKWLMQRHIELTSERWLWLIDELKKRGAFVYGVVQLPVAVAGIEEKYIQDLANLSVDFSPTAGGRIAFEAPSDKGFKISFYRGVIFTDSQSGIYAIPDFLVASSYVPFRVVAISGNPHYLKDLNNQLRKLHLEFFGLHYKKPGVELNDLTHDRVMLQQRMLIQNGVWLEDEYVNILMQQKNEGQ